MSRECKRTSETRHEKHQWFDVHHVGDRGGDERVQRRRSGDNRIALTLSRAPCHRLVAVRIADFRFRIADSAESAASNQYSAMSSVLEEQKNGRPSVRARLYPPPRHDRTA